MPNRTPSNQALRLSLALVLVGTLLLPGGAFGQSIPAENPPADPEGPRPGDTRGPEDVRGPEDGCEDHDEDGDCDPTYEVLGTVFAEHLPHLTDGVQVSYGRAPAGNVYGGRLEWTLQRLQGRRLLLGVGTWIAPTRMLRPKVDEPLRQPTGRDGAVALTLGGSVPLRDLGLSAGRSVRGVAEATVLIGAPGRQVRLSVGPRYRVALQGEARKALTIDLVVGANLSAETVAPRIGLRVGRLWD